MVEALAIVGGALYRKWFGGGLGNSFLSRKIPRAIKLLVGILFGMVLGYVLSGYPAMAAGAIVGLGWMFAHAEWQDMGTVKGDALTDMVGMAVRYGMVSSTAAVVYSTLSHILGDPLLLLWKVIPYALFGFLVGPAYLLAVHKTQKLFPRWAPHGELFAGAIMYGGLLFL